VNGFRAYSNGRESLGLTVGQALDALIESDPQIDPRYILVQPNRPDQFFTSAQQDELRVLSEQHRKCADEGSVMDPVSRQRLEELVEIELLATVERAKKFLSKTNS
jgi:hypothetical protein